MGLKDAYVQATAWLREATPPTVLARLEASPRPAVRHVRSLLSIYDAEDLARLDLPWWSYRATRAIERFLSLRPQARVFEYGAGASTAWLARRAGSVDTVEHDAGFAAVARRLVAGADHVTLHVVPATPIPAGAGAEAVRSERDGYQGLDFAAYVATIDRVGGPFDLIVIDGRARVAALRRALPHLAPDGAVVFDDVERRRYAPALTAPGTTVHVLRGATPGLPYPTSTAILRPRTDR
jgi:predicted O-methyltransferase YrrM